ncbi:hypothetical protein BDV11DRAFT_191243 [Aspergillus similis]
MLQTLPFNCLLLLYLNISFRYTAGLRARLTCRHRNIVMKYACRLNGERAGGSCINYTNVVYEGSDAV